MSIELETLNQGRVPDFGFWGPDITRVMLGDLPAMRLVDFCRYATNILITVIPLIKEVERKQIMDSVKWITSTHEKMSIRPDNEVTEASTYSDERPAVFLQDSQQIEEFVSSLNPGGKTVVDYTRNPFLVQEGNINIANTYLVAPAHFADLTLSILHGGFMGWSEELGVPECADRNLRRLLAVAQE